MKKFVCAHCGHRLAVAPRHYGKLVTCPECARITHPLAEQILKSAEPAPAKASDSPTTACANCGQPIGKLQKRHEWKKSVVCTDCHHSLTREAEATSTTKKKSSTVVEPQVVRVPPADTSATSHAAKAATGLVVAAGSAILPYAAQKASTTMPLAWRHRALILLALACIVGAALYGALTLLKDLTGVFTSFAAILLGIAVLYVLLRIGWAAGKRAVGRQSDVIKTD